MSIAAYRQTIVETDSARNIERRLFTSVTNDLSNFSEVFDKATANGEKLGILADGLRAALWNNEKIWLALRNDLIEPGNALNNELKASLISIAFWVERYTPQVMKGLSMVAPLIAINNSIIKGLNGDVDQDEV